MFLKYTEKMSHLTKYSFYLLINGQDGVGW